MNSTPATPAAKSSSLMASRPSAILVIRHLSFLGFWSLVIGHITLSCAAADLPLTTWQGETMGSVYTVKLVDANLADKQLAELKLEVDQILIEVNRQMSHYQTNSELSRFNRGPAGRAFKISPEFACVLRLSMELNRRSQGAFEPTLGQAINLWGFGEKTTVRQVPSEAALQEALTNTGLQHLSLNKNDELVKDIPGLQVNLSAIAKGFGADQMARVLQKHSLSNFYVSISGEVFVSGHNPKGKPWSIGVSAPVSNWRPGDPTVAVISVSGQAVSTSGDYQKFFFDAQGHRLAHIFDPKTGRPVQHNLGSVTVVATNCTLADGLATTLFVLGAEKGKELVETWTNAAALFVVREKDGSFRQIPSSRFTAMTGYAP